MSPIDQLKHPTLKCTLRGVASSSTVQFRNLKYASIPARFKDAVPNDTLGSDVFDATQFGPSCPQKRGAQAWDLSLAGNVNLPCELGQGGSESMNEFDCLHVNVTVPKSSLAHKDKTPVFVWVHGGGLSMGSNNWPQYELRRLVERSIEINKPMVGVAINYRVGILGFLASKEFGAGGNMGFKDQALAFRWIKKHIAGFGGDPNNITAAGESAGGISLSTLLCANVSEKLFERTVIMSGEATLRKPRKMQWHETMCHDQLKYLGLEGSDRDYLIQGEAEELTNKLPLAQHFCGLIDQDWLRSDVTLSMLTEGKSGFHKPAWCKEFVIGDTAHDGTILKARILDNPNALADLNKACSQLLSHPEKEQLLAAYSLTSGSEQHRGMLCLASELRFYYPALAVHSGWTKAGPPQQASRYHFSVQNPLKGAFTGLSSHELDVAFLLQNLNEFFSDHDRKVAKQMADQFIRFANGNGWCKSGQVVVIDGNGVRSVDQRTYDHVFRDGRGKMLESIGSDRVWRLAEAWQKVKSDNEELDARAKL